LTYGYVFGLGDVQENDNILKEAPNCEEDEKLPAYFSQKNGINKLVDKRD
jgi:hypothetical protein